MARIFGTLLPLVFTLLLAGCVLPPIAPAPAPPAETGTDQVPQMKYYAAFNRLLDSERDGIRVTHAAMSANGETIFYTGENERDEFVAGLVEVVGGEMTPVSVPTAINAGYAEAVISYNGARSFFKEHGPEGGIYKVENGTATKIFEIKQEAGVDGLARLQTTADGEWVYFQDSFDIWRVSHDGSVWQEVLDDNTVERTEGIGFGVENFAISEDGSVIVFTLWAYRPEAGAAPIRKDELFIMREGTVRQLTDETELVNRENLGISPDGSTAVFHQTDSGVHGPAGWYAVDLADGDVTFVREQSLTTGDDFPVLTHNGDRFLVRDWSPGAFVATDGSGTTDLLPSYGDEIELVASRQASVSKDGTRIAFVYVPDVHNPPVFLYVGYLEEPAAIDGGPIIDEVYLGAPAIAADNPDARMDVKAEVSHVNGQESIVAATIDQLSNGILLSSIEAPLAFPQPSLRNDGEDPDTVAGDKLWSGVARPSTTIGDFSEVTLRVAAMDDNRSVVLRDRVLRIE